VAVSGCGRRRGDSSDSEQQAVGHGRPTPVPPSSTWSTDRRHLMTARTTCSTLVVTTASSSCPRQSAAVGRRQCVRDESIDSFRSAGGWCDTRSVLSPPLTTHSSIAPAPYLHSIHRLYRRPTSNRLAPRLTPETCV